MENTLPLGKGARSSLWLIAGSGMAQEEVWILEVACDQWRASLWKWHWDPAGACTSNLNSDTSFYLVLDFPLNTL